MSDVSFPFGTYPEGRRLPQSGTPGRFGTVWSGPPRTDADSLAFAERHWGQPASREDYERRGRRWVDRASGEEYERIPGNPLLGTDGVAVAAWFVDGEEIVALRRPGSGVTSVSLGSVDARKATGREPVNNAVEVY